MENELKIFLDDGIKTVQDYIAKDSGNLANITLDAIQDVFKIKHYIPFEVKQYSSRGICEALLEPDYQIDSVDKYLNFIIFVIREYTNIEVQPGQYAKIYDKLASTYFDYNTKQVSLLNLIVEVIGSDYKECQTIFNMTYDDMIRNHNSVESFVDRKIERLGDIAESSLGKLEDFLKTLDTDSLGKKAKRVLEAARAKAEELKK